MSLRGQQAFINFVCQLAQLSLSYPHYSCISKQTKMVNVTFKTKIKKPSST
ncbi:Mobile element protein [Candidatus Enterovibrio altilux]|uniref:Mobile element protein n=1 Tax=Candidatus Enterovibrio altilux TaxID=1927128 RepID=A0A291B8Z6_9GAMM|nr:Mobile element protein [Candidatus Enterovibrio luxaltus]